MNAKDKKVYLPQKCLQPFDYVNNGYNPTGNDVRDNFGFFKNVDYTDIIFEMIFTEHVYDESLICNLFPCTLH